MIRNSQAALFAPRAEGSLRAGPLCVGAASARRWDSPRNFAGHREAVLVRDGRVCQGCGAADQRVVHHRRPGRYALAWLVTLCPACHARVHRLRANRRWLPSRLLALWQEQHPGVPVQLQLPIERPAEGGEAAAA